MRVVERLLKRRRRQWFSVSADRAEMAPRRKGGFAARPGSRRRRRCPTRTGRRGMRGDAEKWRMSLISATTRCPRTAGFGQAPRRGRQGGGGGRAEVRGRKASDSGRGGQPATSSVLRRGRRGWWDGEDLTTLLGGPGAVGPGAAGRGAGGPDGRVRRPALPGPWPAPDGRRLTPPSRLPTGATQGPRRAPPMPLLLSSGTERG